MKNNLQTTNAISFLMNIDEHIYNSVAGMKKQSFKDQVIDQMNNQEKENDLLKGCPDYWKNQDHCGD